jgi:Sulfotransferase family
LGSFAMNTSGGHRFIFICGLHRSGTSPLFRILREHPEISGFSNTGAPEDEGQHLQTVFPAAQMYGGPGRFGFVPEAHLTEQSGLITAENRRRLFEEWSRYWDLTKPWLLEKSPPNLIRTRFLQAVFPDSYFIVIFRHPVAVSLATRKWTRSSLDSLLEHWLHCHGLFKQDSPHLRHLLLIRYEDLIQTSELTLGQIYRFLGLRPHLSTALNPAGNEHYFSDWRKKSNAIDSGAVCRHLTEKYEQEVQLYGYSLTDCANQPVGSPV